MGFWMTDYLQHKAVFECLVYNGNTENSRIKIPLLSSLMKYCGFGCISLVLFSTVTSLIFRASIENTLLHLFVIDRYAKLYFLMLICVGSKIPL